MKRILAAILCCVMLCGCAPDALLAYYGVTPFSDMTYTRPDMDAIAESCRSACAVAAESTDTEEILDAVWDFYDVYDEFSTNYDLAYIHYHGNPADAYWQAEQEFCAEQAGRLDQHLEELYRTLALSPVRSELEEEYFGEGYFLDYEGEAMYDETLLDLLSREQSLISHYYTLDSEAVSELYSPEWYDECALPMADVLAELALVRGDLAEYLGYESYPAFAWDYYYYRDYTPAQADAYLEEIRQELVPVYRQMQQLPVWDAGDVPCSEGEILSYVRSAAGTVGEVTKEACTVMELGKLYDISVDPDKSGLSFETFLDWYYEPYIFISGTGTAYDCLTFAHEFGHFANDYASGGSWAGTDVLEFFSQGMEYLSLRTADGGEALTELKLADSLSTYVEQAAYAAFESAMYALPESELTGENLLALYERICRGYGFDCLDWEPRDMVTVPHFYGSPMYIISYVVSNDAAMQLYELELADPGAGQRVFTANLDTEAQGLMEFLEEAELESPFGRVGAVRKLMEERFGTGGV